ncbi:MAG TPA: FHA domain-containing protein [Actinomycetota bacterium]|nr:FHA domain-containing protein [Actinomycetota bacterium]
MNPRRRASVYCTRCGHRNPDDARFCARCGASLEEETTVSLTPVEVEEEVTEELPPIHGELEPGQALLVVKRGPNAGSTFLLERDVTTAGRGPENDVFLDDITVSRRHAEIVRREDGFFIRDLGSLNGTYVNRERVEETKLASGDEVQVGKFKLVFLAAEDRAAGGE